MEIKQYNIYRADLDRPRGTEVGKQRPVVVIQTDLLNDIGHRSTIVCPITTNVISTRVYTRVHIRKNECGLKKDSDILCDQMRSIDNTRLIEHIGKLDLKRREELKEKVYTILFE